MYFSLEDNFGKGLILFTISGKGTACVENYWFCEVIIQGEGITNYQFARM